MIGPFFCTLIPCYRSIKIVFFFFKVQLGFSLFANHANLEAGEENNYCRAIPVVDVMKQIFLWSSRMDSHTGFPLNKKQEIALFILLNLRLKQKFYTNPFCVIFCNRVFSFWKRTRFQNYGKTWQYFLNPKNNIKYALNILHRKMYNSICRFR